MQRFLGSIVARYVATFLFIAVATGLRFLLEPVLGANVPFILYFPTVVICAWFGGLWQGLLAAFLGGFIAWLFFIPSEFSFRVYNHTAFVQMIVFLFASALISFLAEDLHQARRRSEEGENKEREQRERLRVTLSSIGDAVIATDDQGCVTLMNHVAESLTGWKFEQVTGRKLEEIFSIINSHTRQPVQNPALRAMKEGLIVGLANDTILISKDGSEIPIDDSGAPIRDIEGKVLGAVLIFRDISERNDAAERFRLAVEAAPNSMIMVNDEGKILLLNSQTEKLFGYSREELIGESIEMLIPERYRLHHPDHRSAFTGNAETRPMGKGMDLYGLRKDGTEIPIEIGLNPITVAGKTLVLSAIVDITERKKAEEERLRMFRSERAARAEAETANRAKDVFLATVSHELRTPLSTIFGWVRLLKGGMLDASQSAKGLDAIEQSVKLQARLVDDLFDVSRILSGKLELDLVPVDLRQIIKESVESIRPAARAKSIDLDLNVDSADGVMIGDQIRLQQVIGNLITNSLKFTPAGGRIMIELQEFEKQIRLKIADTGKGIDPELLPHLFERFYQGRNARQYGGLGLGLAIVRHVVEMHGGNVNAESPGENRGAIFTVNLPMKDPDVRSSGNAPTSTSQ